MIKLTNNKSKIPNFVIYGSEKIKGAFIKGIADSDGSVDDTRNRRQIVITQKDTKQLEAFKNLFLSLFIQSEIYEKTNNSSHLVISLLRNLKRFNEIVGFSIAYKKEKLEKGIDYLEKTNKSNFYWESLQKRINSIESSEKIATEMCLKPGTFRSWISGRRLPRQIKKDIAYGWVPENYENLRKRFKFLPKVMK
jgi:intein/homing endonuclease